MVGQGEHHQLNLGQIYLSPEIRVARICLDDATPFILAGIELAVVVVHPEYPVTELFLHSVVSPGADIADTQDDDPDISSVRVSRFYPTGFEFLQGVLPTPIQVVRVIIEWGRKNETDSDSLVNVLMKSTTVYSGRGSGSPSPKPVMVSST